MKVKTIFRIVLWICCILILLDFIPVKMAINIEKTDLTKLKTNAERLYICENIITTGTIWTAIGDEQGVRQLEKGVYFTDLVQNDPFSTLNSEFTFDLVQIRNKYIFTGLVLGEKTNEVETDMQFRVNNWYIVYPIERFSIRGLYAPRSYLTVYDYKWCDWFFKWIFEK